MKHNKLFVPVFAPFDLKDAVITLQGGSGSSGALEIKVGQGNLTFKEARNIEYILDRGSLDNVRAGDEVPLDVSLEFIWEYIEGSGSPVDAIKGSTGWVSSDTDGDLCRPYAVNIIITRDLSACEADSETITLNDFRWESLDYNAKEATIAVSGKCNVTEAAVVRIAYTP